MKEKTPVDHESRFWTRLYRAATTLYTLSTLSAVYGPLKNPDTYNHGAVNALMALSVLGLVTAIGSHRLDKH